MFWNRRIYLDRAAGVAGNPSSPHEEGRHAKHLLEDARTTIARLVEVQPDDVLFTSGATEANALAILGSIRALKKNGATSSHALYLPSAHASIVENMHLLREEGVTIDALPIRDGRVDVQSLANMFQDGTALVSMEAVCGETGVVWNTREVAQVLAAHNATSKQRILLHVDASQAPLTEKITRSHFGADLLTFDVSKISEARGIGVLIVHRTIPLMPLYRGGGQERGLRHGTEAPALATQFAQALTSMTESRDTFLAAAQSERTQLIADITTHIPTVFVQEGHTQAPHILNLSFPGRDTDYLVALLNEAGFAVSTRSACETDSEDGSRAVLALTGDPERARATLRISWDAQVRARELRRFARALITAVAFIDKKSSR
jgi:cysteine desulfurase